MPHRKPDAADRHLRSLLDSRIIGQSPPMVRLKLLPRVARSRSSVLIHGESGTGKELVARVGELPERIIDHALSEPEGTALGEGRPHERVMIEMALARFSGDKAKAARFIGWTTDELEKIPVKAWKETFRAGGDGWRAAA